MWKLLFMVALPFAPLAAAHTGDPVGSVRAGAADVQCLVRTEPLAGGIELEGVVATKRPLSGTYRFDVRKTGPAGTSTSVQNGQFEARPSDEVVAHAGLGLEPGASYDARLVLRWKGGEASCAASGPDRAGRS